MKTTICKSVLLSTLVLAFSYGYANTSAVCSNNVSHMVTSDTFITQQVRCNIAADKTISNLPVKVETINGVVLLSGKVNTDNEASTLIERAASVNGVTNINTSKLLVKQSTQPFTDTVITGKVKGIFLREKLFGSKPVPVMSINVETKNGIVYLTGTADSQAQIQNAIDLAKDISGVNQVHSTVQVTQ